VSPCLGIETAGLGTRLASCPTNAPTTKKFKIRPALATEIGHEATLPAFNSAAQSCGSIKPTQADRSRARSLEAREQKVCDAFKCDLQRSEFGS
jgi:hypothetical protein